MREILENVEHETRHNNSKLALKNARLKKSL